MTCGHVTYHVMSIDEHVLITSCLRELKLRLFPSLSLSLYILQTI